VSSTALDRLSSIKNLRSVWRDYWPKARRSTPGVDGITAIQFNENLPAQLSLTRQKLLCDYTCSRLRCVAVPKKDPNKFRIICVPTFQDRLVQKALLNFIEPRSTSLGIANDVSFGFVKTSPGNKRGVVAARAAAIEHRRLRGWVFKTDITAFFDRISREDLVDRFGKAFSLKSLLPVIQEVVNCEADSSSPRIRRILRDNGIEEGCGLRQGMPISPLLSNFVLRDFDNTFINRASYLPLL